MQSELATAAAKRFCSAILDAYEAVIFNNSAGHELFLGRCLFGLQGPGATGPDRCHCNTPVRFGWPLFAICLALVARVRSPRPGLGSYRRNGPGTDCIGPAAAGLWQF